MVDLYIFSPRFVALKKKEKKHRKKEETPVGTLITNSDIFKLGLTVELLKIFIYQKIVSAVSNLVKRFS